MFKLIRSPFHRSPDPIDLPAPAAAATAPAPDSPAAIAIPRYPPFLEGLPTAPVTQVVATQTVLLERLQQTLGLPAEVYAQVAEPVLRRYAAWVHLLPASEAHHHRGGGGLWRHGLEVALFSVQAAQGRIFGYGEPPARRRELEPRWQLAALLAGLCHDLGKPVTDLTVTTVEGFTWNPWLEPLGDWLLTMATARYYLHWRGGRHGQHEIATLAVAPRVLPPASLAWLAEADPAIVQALLEALAGVADRANPLAELIAAADRHSVEQDLRTWRALSGQSAQGVPVEQYLLDAMRRRLRAGTWTVNAPGARVWVLADGVYLVWRAAARDIVDLLAQDRVAGIPRDPDTLADILLERGLATPRELPQGRYRYWRITPALLTGERTEKPVVLYTLRLAPSLLFEGQPPAPVAARILAAEAEDGTALTAPSEAATAATPPGVKPERAAAATAPETAPGGPEPKPEASAPAAVIGPGTVATPPAAAVATAPAKPPAAAVPAPAAPLAPDTRLVIDFIHRLGQGWQANTLPFAVERHADGWRMPWDEASNWYIRLTGISRSSLMHDLRQPVGGERLAEIDNRQRGCPAVLVLPATALAGADPAAST